MNGIGSCCALRAGAVSCWGANDYGQLGDGTKQSVPVLVNVVGF